MNYDWTQTVQNSKTGDEVHQLSKNEPTPLRQLPPEPFTIYLRPASPTDSTTDR